MVAIDVSKLRNDVLIELPGNSRRRRLTVLNSRAEHDRFVSLLTDLGLPVIIGFEANGNYHRPLAYRLLETGFELRLVSSVALARTREALHIGWDKNDPKDAQVILHMRQPAAQHNRVFWRTAADVLNPNLCNGQIDQAGFFMRAPHHAKAIT